MPACNRSAYRSRSALLLAVVFPATAFAANRFWVGPDGAVWNGSTAYWSTTSGGVGGASIPAALDNVYAETTGASKSMYFTGPDYTGAALGGLRVDGSATGTLAFNLLSSNLVTAGESIGYQHNAAFNQSAGVNIVNGTLFLGLLPGGNGTYNLNGGTVAATSETISDDANTCTFNQQTGTTHSVTTLTLASFTPLSRANYSLVDGNLNVAGSEILGDQGIATFTQGGGFHNVGATLTVANTSGSSGTYNYNGGVFNASTLLLKAGGTLNLFDGYLFYAQSLIQTGGSVSCAGKLYTSNASYSLSGGTLLTNNHDVGYFSGGTMTQTGGTETVTSTLSIGSGAGTTSTYNLSGSSARLSSASTIVSAGGGQANFVQSGGTHITTDLYVGQYPNFLSGSGSYSLLAGFLQAPHQHIGGSSAALGTFFQSGGTNSASSDLTIYSGSSYTLALGTLAAAALTNTGSIVQNQGVISSGNFNNAGLYTFTGGTISGTLNNNGAMSVQGLLQADTINNYSPVNLVTGTLATTSASGLTNYSTLALAGGGLAGSGPVTNRAILTGFGTLTNSGSFANDASLIANNGPLVFSGTGSSANFGSLSINTPGELDVATTFANHGTASLDGSILGGAGAFTNAFDGVLDGPGSVLVSTFVNQGLLLAPAGTTRVNSAFTNSGTIQLDDPAANLTGGTVSNASTVQGFGRFSSQLSNAGTVEALGGTLNLAGPLTNATAGLLRVSAGNKLLVSGTFPTNAGTVSLTGGTFDTNGQPLTNAGQITGFGTLATGGLTNAGSIFLSGGLTTVNGAVTNNAAQLIKVQFNPAIFTGAVTNNGTINVVSTTALFAGGISGNPAAEPTGVSTFTGLQSASLSAFVPFAGDLTVSAGGSIVASFLRQSSLTNSGAVTLRPASQGGDTSVVSAVSLNPGSSLDLADTRLVWDYGTTAPITTLRQYLQSKLLTSSIASSDPQQRQAIGYVDSALLGVTAWGGQAVDSASLLTKLTWLGDANLDGVVNADDYALIDRGYAQYGSGAIPAGTATWAQGDFNYDGAVNSQDYLLIDRVFLQQSGTLDPALLAQREAQFGPAYVQELVASVPEPSVAVICLLALPLCIRSRRRGENSRL